MKFDEEIYNNYEVYREVVYCLTKLLKIEKDIGQTIDHVLPVSFGFNWKIPPNLIADKRNIKVTDQVLNSKKSYKCESIPKYIQKYMINYHYRTIKERQMDGIRKAKENGFYTGRKKGTKESVDEFLQKPKIKIVVECINNGWKHVDIAEKFDVHINTVTKVKKILKYKE
jgi:hypothetical protein